MVSAARGGVKLGRARPSDERLRLGDPVREYGCLQGDLGTFIVGMVRGPAERAYQRVPAQEMIGRLAPPSYE